MSCLHANSVVPACHIVIESGFKKSHCNYTIGLAKQRFNLMNRAVRSRNLFEEPLTFKFDRR